MVHASSQTGGSIVHASSQTGSSMVHASSQRQEVAWYMPRTREKWVGVASYFN